MSDHHFIFGETPCLIRVKAGSLEHATVFVVFDRGISPILDGRNNHRPVTLEHSGRFEALGQAMRYLRHRFGIEGAERPAPTALTVLEPDPEYTDHRPIEDRGLSEYAGTCP